MSNYRKAKAMTAECHSGAKEAASATLHLGLGATTIALLAKNPESIETIPAIGFYIIGGATCLKGIIKTKYVTDHIRDKHVSNFDHS